MEAAFEEYIGIDGATHRYGSILRNHDENRYPTDDFEHLHDLRVVWSFEI